MTGEPARRPGQLAFSLLLLIFSMLAAWQAHRISGLSSPSAPGVFPMLAAAVMVLSAGVIVAGDLRKRREEGSGLRRFVEGIAPPKLLVFSAAVVAYMVALEPAGFLVSSFAFLLFGFWFLYRRGIIAALLLAVGSLAVIHVLFRTVFSVVLPKGAFL